MGQMLRAMLTSVGTRRWAACLLPAVGGLTLFAYLNWNVVGQAPYYDEMWKLDLVVPSGTVARYFSNDTPIPIGWLFLNKALLFFTPDNFAVARSFGPIWVAVATALLVWNLSKTSGVNWAFVAGATFLATCLPMHSIIRNFNQYSFEVFYSVAMVCLALRPIQNPKRRLAALLFVAIAPLFTISSMFFLPGVFAALLWNCPPPPPPPAEGGPRCWLQPALRRPLRPWSICCGISRLSRSQASQWWTIGRTISFEGASDDSWRLSANSQASFLAP
jgi:hypothetical protein